MTDQELKPCPFCGTRPALIYPGTNQRQVGCRSDRCKIQPHTMPSERIEVVVQEWNTRHAYLSRLDRREVDEEWLLSVGFRSEFDGHFQRGVIVIVFAPSGKLWN